MNWITIQKADEKLEIKTSTVDKIKLFTVSGLCHLQIYTGNNKETIAKGKQANLEAIESKIKEGESVTVLFDEVDSKLKEERKTTPKKTTK